MIRNYMLKIVAIDKQLKFLVILMNRVSYELHSAISYELFAELPPFHRPGHDAAAPVPDHSLSGYPRIF